MSQIADAVLSFQAMGGEENLDLKYESREFLYMKVAKGYETSEILLSTCPHASHTGYLLLRNPKVRPKHSFEDVRNPLRNISGTLCSRNRYL